MSCFSIILYVFCHFWKLISEMRLILFDVPLHLILLMKYFHTGHFCTWLFLDIGDQKTSGSHRGHYFSACPTPQWPNTKMERWSSASIKKYQHTLTSYEISELPCLFRWLISQGLKRRGHWVTQHLGYSGFRTRLDCCEAILWLESKIYLKVDEVSLMCSKSKTPYLIFAA